MLRDYETNFCWDFFQLAENEAGEVQFKQLAFPCCCCEHNENTDQDDPCYRCSHNANSVFPKVPEMLVEHE